MSPMFRRIPEHLDGATRTTISRIARTELLVVVENGMLPPASGCRRSVHRLIGAADERHSVVVTNKPASVRVDTIVPKTLASAAVRAVAARRYHGPREIEARAHTKEAVRAKLIPRQQMHQSA